MSDKNDDNDGKDHDDDKVGYKNPPKHTRFKPGESGNHKGRSKGTKNLKTDLLEEFGEKIRIREGNREITVSKQRALIKTRMVRGLKGNDRAAERLIDLFIRVVGIEINAADAGTPLTADEREVLINLEKRILRKAEMVKEAVGKAP